MTNKKVFNKSLLKGLLQELKDPVNALMKI